MEFLNKFHKVINEVITHMITEVAEEPEGSQHSRQLCNKKAMPPPKTTEQGLKFAQYHENWTVEDWKRVLWTDETKFNRIGSDGKVYVWKQ